MTGCAVMQPEVAVSTSCACEEQQQEISRLQQMLAEKEAEINRLQAHQQDQKKELEETTSEAARAEIKLRRFATEADVASRLAEVEVAMEVLQSKLGAEHQVPLQVLAQQLLDTASASFKRGDYSEAADFAAQAEQLIDMFVENDSALAKRAASESPFKIAIPLRIKADTRLRRQPHDSAITLDVLQKTTPVTARGYQGQWLHVQTEDGNTGWVLSESLEPR